MSVLICGSMAYDCIFEYQGEFKDANLGNYSGTLNASFLASSLNRHFGGCAGNVAYGLKLLGGNPKIFAAMGVDANDYLQYLEALDISAEYIKILPDMFTVQLMIINDSKQNQINTFYPGAMAFSHLNKITDIKNLSEYKIAIVSPDGKDGMVEHVKDLANAGINVIFDAGQAMPLFSKEELLQSISYSKYVIVNEYECDMLLDKTAYNIQEFIQNLEAFIVTLADKGACLYNKEFPNGIIIQGVKADRITDPTGCGDAFRAGFIYGLENNLPIQEAIRIGNKMGAHKIAYSGGQGYPKFAV